MQPTRRRPRPTKKKKPDKPKPKPKRGNFYRCELMDGETMYVGTGATKEKAERDALRVAFKRSGQERYDVKDFDKHKTKLQRGPQRRISDEEKEKKAKGA